MEVIKTVLLIQYILWFLSFVLFIIILIRNRYNKIEEPFGYLVIGPITPFYGYVFIIVNITVLLWFGEWNNWFNYKNNKKEA